MPRLNHKKARTGCQRCKARKVKCDEQKPKCSACLRHNVPCEYVEPPPRRADAQQSFAGATREGYAVGAAGNDETRGLDPRLEVRLMHEWTAYTCQSLSSQSEFWRFQAPLIAMEHRLVLDSMFGLAALDFSRRSPSQWIPMDGRMIQVRHPVPKPTYATKDLSTHWREAENEMDASNTLRNAYHPDILADKRRQEMLMNARMYFDRAIDGHQKGLQNLTRENVEAVYITSVLVSFHALFTLSENEEESLTFPALDPMVWFRLADGTRYLCDIWRTYVGEEWLENGGIYFGKEKLVEEDALFRQEQGKPFEALLTFAEDLVTTPEEDKDAYQKCLSYIAFVYKSIVEGSDPPLSNCRRLVALPSRLPKRFGQLVESRSSRAFVLLAHVFALMKLISDKIPWFQGLAERQIPKIQQQIPPGWQELMAWPVKIAESRFDDILPL